MAEIYQFPTKRDSSELDRLHCKLIELNEAKEAILREIRLTKDLIKLFESGEPK
jgi:hypothetical protein